MFCHWRKRFLKLYLISLFILKGIASQYGAVPHYLKINLFFLSAHNGTFHWTLRGTLQGTLHANQTVIMFVVQALTHWHCNWSYKHTVYTDYVLIHFVPVDIPCYIHNNLMQNVAVFTTWMQYEMKLFIIIIMYNNSI